MADNDNPIQIEVQRFLGGVDYPAGKNELLERARTSGATEDVVSALERLPDRQFDDPTDVSEAL